MQPPPLGARLVARFLDAGIIGIPAGIAARLAGFDEGARLAFVALIAIAYEAISLGAVGRTIGKRVCNIGVVDLEGQPPTERAAVIRAVVLLVPAYLIAPRVDTVGEWLVLGLVLANCDVIAKRRDDRRGIHDLAAGTRAIAAAPVA